MEEFNLDNLNTDHLYIAAAGIVFILIVIYFIMNKKDYTINNQTYSDKISIKQSLIPNSGRGVFANKDFKQGEIIEVCPLITDYKKNFSNSKITDYTFKSKFKSDQEVIVFGMCSMYNHSNKFNVHHTQDPENMIYKAGRDIKNGEELYVSYGADYWDTRNN